MQALEGGGEELLDSGERLVMEDGRAVVRVDLAVVVGAFDVSEARGSQII